MSAKRLWPAFGMVTTGSFVVLEYYGMELYRGAPPIPQVVVTTDGEANDWFGLSVGISGTTASAGGAE